MITNSNKITQEWGSSRVTDDFREVIMQKKSETVSDSHDQIVRSVNIATSVCEKDKAMATDALSNAFGKNYRCIPYIPNKDRSLAYCLDYPHKTKVYNGTIEIIRRRERFHIKSAFSSIGIINKKEMTEYELYAFKELKNVVITYLNTNVVKELEIDREKVSESLLKKFNKLIKSMRKNDDYEISYNIDAPDLTVRALSMLSLKNSIEDICRSMSEQEYRYLVRWAKLFQFEDVTCMDHIYGKDVFEIDRGLAENNNNKVSTHFNDSNSYSSFTLNTELLSKRLRKKIYSFLASKSVDLDNEFDDVDIKNLVRVEKKYNQNDAVLKAYLYTHGCDASNIENGPYIYFERNIFFNANPNVALYIPREKAPSNLYEYVEYFENRKPANAPYRRDTNLNNAEAMLSSYKVVETLLENIETAKNRDEILASQECYDFQDNMVKYYIADTTKNKPIDAEQDNLNNSIEKLQELFNYIDYSGVYEKQLQDSDLTKQQLLGLIDAEYFVNGTETWRVFKFKNDRVYKTLKMPDHYSFNSLSSDSTYKYDLNEFGWIYPLAFYECLCGDGKIELASDDATDLKTMAECLYKSKNFVRYSAIPQFTPNSQTELIKICADRENFRKLDDIFAQLIQINALNMEANIYGVCNIFNPEERNYIGSTKNERINVKNGELRENNISESIRICTSISQGYNMMSKSTALKSLSDLRNSLNNISFTGDIEIIIEFNEDDEVISDQIIGATCDKMMTSIRRYAKAHPYTLL